MNVPDHDNNTIGRETLVEAIYWAWERQSRWDATKPRLTKKAINALVKLMFVEIEKGIRKNRRFAFPDFGVFTVRVRKARMGSNPQTRRPIKIPAHRTIGFKPSPELKRGL